MRKAKKSDQPKPEDKGLKLKKAPPDFNFDELRLAALHLISERNLPVISGLLRVSDFIRDDDKVPTAAIGRINGKVTILYNGDFVYTYASTPLGFSTVLLHEIMHELLGHLKIENYPGDRELWNLVQDVIINQTLFHLNRDAVSVSDYGTSRPTISRTNPDPGFHVTKLFEDMYPLEGLTALLRPPSILARLRIHEKTGNTVIDKMRREVYPILQTSGSGYSRIYGSPRTSQVTEYDLYNFISNNFQRKDYCNITLIGAMKEDQEPSGRNGSESKGDDGENKSKGFKPGVGAQWDDSTLIEVCEEIDRSSRNAGHNPTELSKRVLKKIRTKSRDLEMAFDQALLNGAKSKIAALLGGPPKVSRSVIPSSGMSRSDILKLSAGYWPLFFSKSIVGDRRQKAHVYVDVSGSVDNYVEWMYGCIQEIEKNTEVVIHLFSNKVFDITKEEFEKRVVRTTGGTDFDCVAVHALEENKKTGDDKFVIFTDGYASISDENLSGIRDKKLLFIGALLGKTRDRNEEVLRMFCQKVFLIPEIQNNSERKNK